MTENKRQDGWGIEQDMHAGYICFHTIVTPFPPHPVFSDVRRGRPEAPGGLQEAGGEGPVSDHGPRDLRPDPQAHQRPLVLPQALRE